MLKRYAPGDGMWYALRRTLPPFSWRENLGELLDFCKDSGVDEVIVKVDTEEFSHNHMEPSRFGGLIHGLNEIREGLTGAGIYYSLNPWITLGHCDRGRDNRILGYTMMAGHDGSECRACVCPLDEGWRASASVLWGMYASTGPRVIWVEDDIRTWNHRPVEYGCFCRLHLQKFSDLIGEKVSGESLVKALLSPGDPHPWRMSWLDMQGDIMVETAGLLALAVHKVNPGISMGLMSSGPDRHCLEGRKWGELSDALRGKNKTLLSRPPLGVYSEQSLRGFYYGASSIRRTRKALPDGVLELTEIENVPFSIFSKSVAFTGLQMALSAALGCSGMTMNLFDHLGSPIADTPEYGALLSGKKKYLAALASRSTSRGRFLGAGILQHEKAAFYRKLTPGGSYSDLADDGSSWAGILEGLGIGVSWDWENSPVLALSGQTARAFGEDGVAAMLSGGVLCDLSGALSLIDMGFSEELGIQVDEVRPVHDYGPAAAEELFDESFKGAPGRYLSATMPSLGSDALLGRLSLLEGARAASRLVDMDGKELFALLTIFENRAGGRTAVLPYDLRALPEGSSFMHPYRRMQLCSVMRWLSREKLPLFVEGGAHALPVLADEGGYSRITVFNLSLDPWEKTRIFVYPGGKTPAAVEFLGPDGAWKKLDDSQLGWAGGGYFSISHEDRIDFNLPGAWCVFWD